MLSVPVNALTVDVEDYFHVTAFERVVSPSEWDRYPLRVGDNTRRVLDLFDRYSLRGTFFVLGWVAERDPGLVREIQRRGHEIACHGYSHQLVYRIGPEAFREDITRAKALLEDISGEQVHGYRAPSYSITARSLWALDILAEEGFSYDSSIFPVHHDIYGMPGTPRFPHTIRRPSGSIREFPLSTFMVRLFGKEIRLPIAGGGYLRMFPASWISAAMKSINERDRQPAVLYFHPWEIDPGQPRIAAGMKSRFRHYLNLERTCAKLERLFTDLEFAPMRGILAHVA
jgi:polysaccharide deacetylase family protein (PEP-CTERM system associated)